MTVAWSHMEANLSNVIMNLGGINSHVCQALTIDAGSQLLINSIQISVTEFCTDAGLVAQWNKLLEEIQAVRSERNSIVHGQWMWRYEHPDIYSVVVCDLSAKGPKLTMSSLNRTPESLRSLANDTFDLIDEMQQLVVKTIPALREPLKSVPRGIQVVNVAPGKKMRKPLFQRKRNGDSA
ncbi:hypothetical protein GCM10025770_39750 [Viridibacterium curvum]|uniref:Apea-like HEPN domain-containing protein n=1 Tax=Viridibacterium curvum TaxID=1101404 RepID=A0ABP9R8D4_9RHOO